MKRKMDVIQFESKAEIENLMDVIAKYVKQNPSEKENENLKEFYSLLDQMEMMW